MAKDGFLTAKAVANRIKAKGLQKLRWFCQICEKQCRDENGFKCHITSESHQRKILLVAESPEKYVNNYSGEFQRDFMKLLSSRYGTRRVNANLVYQEFIADRTHLHMNATKWATLSEFAMHLGKEGLAIVDETPKGWFITWIDNSPKTLARQEAIAKKERMEMDDEQREQKLIQQQIEKAAALKHQEEENGTETATELVRENEEEKIKLDISIKPAGTGFLTGGLKLGGAGAVKPKSLNALAAKKPNPFSSKIAAPSSPSPAPVVNTTPMPPTSSANDSRKRTAVEEIMEQEMARKRRLEVMSGSGRSDRDGAASRSDRDGSSRSDRDGSSRSERDSSSRSERDSSSRSGRDGSSRWDKDESRSDREGSSRYDREGSSRHDRDSSSRPDRDSLSRSDRDYRDRDRERERDRDYDRHRDSYRRDR
ncbi:MAG: domain of Kin17 curved DNA-binding protein-domain-containing protein [Podila humilis]|nr:MAG: domain of Kin17 curved DNA-binding protein-domain-containing protein [Podila humilis]